MRIGIDARFFGPIGKGLGRYTQRLIENLENIDIVNDYFVFLRRENFNDYQPKNKKFQKVLTDYNWYTFSEQINMPKILNKHQLDLVHFPHFNVPIFYRKKFVITIHDLILIHFPTVKNTTLNPFYYWLKFAAYKFVIWSAIRRAKKIIAVSNFTREDILKHYSVPRNKVVLTYEACDVHNEKTAENSSEILKRYVIIKPYIIYVGNAYPHKNLEALVLAFKKIKDKKGDLQLVLVGRENYFYQRLKKMVSEENIGGVNFPGFVPDDDLDVLYKNAELYVFPSLYEGFGIPPLEAMARGVAVASSDHECMKEVLGDAAYYFDANYPDKITEALIFLLDNNVLKNKLREKGYRQVKKYSWQKMAEDTLKIYQNV
jgi:glycosyltransferase involved in cell wall biosynthesis